MKVYKSTAECSEYNTLNADAISTGLIEAIEPNERQLLHEKLEAERTAKAKRRAEAKKALILQLDPNATDNKVHGVTVSIESSGRYNPEFRMYFGGTYGQRPWVKLGNGELPASLDETQLAKARKKIADLREEARRQDNAWTAEKNRYSGWKALISTPEGRDVVKAITGSDYISEYTIECTANPDGTITYKGDRFTRAQWMTIYNMRQEHAAAMKALKEAYRTELKCCERDHNSDGNCDVHSAPGVAR